MANVSLDFRQVRYDVRGQGISDQPLNNASYVSKPHAQDFKAVIDYFGIGKSRPILAGWYGTPFVFH